MANNIYGAPQSSEDSLWGMVQGWADEMHHNNMHQSAYARHRGIDRSRLNKLLKMRDLPEEVVEYIQDKNPSERSVFAALKCEPDDVEGMLECLNRAFKRPAKPVKTTVKRESKPVKKVEPMDPVQLPTHLNFKKLEQKIEGIKNSVEVASSNEARIKSLEEGLNGLIQRVERVEKDSLERHQEILKAISSLKDPVKSEPTQIEPVKISFKEHLNSLKPSKVIQSVFLTLMAVAMAGVTIVQTQPIYEAVGLGGEWLIPIVATVLAGLAALNFSIKKSFLSFLLCAGVCSYELALVSLGTDVDDKSNHTQKVLQNPEVIALKDHLDMAKQDYDTVKQKYLNPDSKVFENSWYKNKFVEPSMQTYMEAKNSYSQKVEVLSSGFNSMASHLKIAFRLGLIIGLMLLVHAAVEANREAFKKHLV